VLRRLGAGLDLGEETLRGLAALSGEEGAGLHRLLNDPGGPAHAALLELALFPDGESLLEVEEALDGHALTQAEIEETLRLVVGRAPRVVLRTGEGAVTVPLTPALAASRIARFRMSRALPKSFSAAFAPIPRIPCRARILSFCRHAEFAWTPRNEGFVELLARLHAGCPELLAELVRLAVLVLPDLPGRDGVIEELGRLHAWCARCLARNARDTERFSGVNMETRLMLGARLPHVDPERLAVRMEGTARLLFAATGVMPLAGGEEAASAEVVRGRPFGE
jgi:hypothetical protein